MLPADRDDWLPGTLAHRPPARIRGIAVTRTLVPAVNGRDWDGKLCSVAPRIFVTMLS